MSHSTPTYNTIRRILLAHLPPNEETLEQFDAMYEEIMEHIGKIENAEYQKGKDEITGEIGRVITEVEKNNHPDDPKYWENMYCESRNAIVRIDYE